MNDLIIGISSSLIASVLIYFSVKPVRNFINLLFLAFKGNKQIGIKAILLSRDKAYKKIYKDLSKSKEIMILNFKGFSLLDNRNFVQSKLYQLVYQERISKIKFLLLNPNAEKYILKRKKNLDEMISGSSKDDYIIDIKDNINKFKKLNNQTETKTDCYCRLFNEELKWSLIFSENFTLVSFYPLNKIAHKSPCLLVNRKNTLLGDSFEKYFNDVWENHSINAY
ncbi:hypothetical protein K8R33_00005, partial [archaeon]|nr:hypothetical protein [archaeon]